RFESVALGLGEIHLDLYVWHVNLQLRMYINRPLDLRESLLYLLGFTAQNTQIGSEDAHDDLIARSHQHLIDPLIEVGLHIVKEPWVAVDHVADGSQGRV